MSPSPPPSKNIMLHNYYTRALHTVNLFSASYTYKCVCVLHIFHVLSGHISRSILKCHSMDVHHIPHLNSGASPLLATLQKAQSYNLMMWKIHLNAQNNPLSN